MFVPLFKQCNSMDKEFIFNYYFLLFDIYMLPWPESRDP